MSADVGTATPGLAPAAGDRHARRDGADYAEAFARLLPQGEAWSRDPDTVLMRLVRGQAEVWGGVVDARAGDLLEVETDPRFTTEMLPDWERALGLPEPIVLYEVVQTFTPFSFGRSAFGGRRGRIEPPVARRTLAVKGTRTPAPLSLPERRRAVVAKIAEQGGQSRAYFVRLAAALGYDVEITEFRPFQFGLSGFGSARGRIAPPSARFDWRVTVRGLPAVRFRFGASAFGRDRVLAVRRAEDLESVVRQRAPAHTQVVFAYGRAAARRPVRFRFGRSHFGNRILAFAP